MPDLAQKQEHMRFRMHDLKLNREPKPHPRTVRAVIDFVPRDPKPRPIQPRIVTINTEPCMKLFREGAIPILNVRDELIARGYAVKAINEAILKAMRFNA